MVTKTCNKCGESKPLESFAPRSQSLDGRRNDCKKCASDYDKARYLEKMKLAELSPRERGGALQPTWPAYTRSPSFAAVL